MAQNNRKHPVYLSLKIVGAVVVLLVLGAMAVQKNGLFKTADKPVVINGPTAAEAAQQKKTEAVQKQVYNDSAKSDTTPAPPSVVPSDSSLSVSAKQDGASVIVQVKAVNVSAGNCELAIINGPRSSSQSAPIIYQPEFSTCAGFSVPTGSLGPGEWSIKVTVKAQDDAVLSKSVSLQVE